MQQNYNYRKFIVSNTEESLSAALNSISAYIREALGASGEFNNIILRSKWVLTELLTNASKHSRDRLLCFEIHLKNAMLEITKSDCGKPFSFLINNHINSFTADDTVNKRYVIQKDDLCILYATVSNEGALVFEAEDIEIFPGTLNEINEHFGLIIITKSSDKFIYSYDNCTKTNVFRASFKL